MRRLALALALLAAPAMAGVEEAVDAHALPRVAAFAEAAAQLDAAARDACSDALVPAYHEAFDAWMGVSHLVLGPLEEDGRAQAVLFWPDTRDVTGRALGQLLAERDPAALEPAAFAEASVAARGLLALERLLFEIGAKGDYACALVRAITADLAATAAAVEAGWQHGFAEALRTAGAPDNAAFPQEEDARRALTTALVTGLAFTEESRLGRPLGTFDRPRPLRAEARRSERSSRNVVLSLRALREFAAALADAPETLAALDRAIASAEALDDPALAGVAEPGSRIRVEALQGEVGAVREAAEAEIGAALGVRPGFNSLDGD